MIFVDAEFKGGGTGVLEGADTKALGQSEHSLNVENASLTPVKLDLLTERADVGSSAVSTC